MASNAPLTGEPLRNAITNLIALGGVDTLYRDLYLQRGKELLHHDMSPESYRGMLRMVGELNDFPNRIRNTMLQQDWQAVKQMSAELESLQQSYARYSELLQLAKELYEQTEIVIDPFSPGLVTLAGKSYEELPALRERGLSLLSTLARLDGGWRSFYIRRLDDFGVETAQPPPDLQNRATPASGELLQHQAQEALAKGDLNMLREVADALSKGGGSAAAATVGSDTAEGRRREKPLKFAFPEPVLERAGSLGLVPFTVESRYEAYLRFAPYIWNPTFADLENEQGRALRLSTLPLPAQAPEAVRSMLEMFMLHPFINSAGIRSIATLVEEDGLVEEFEEPAAGDAAPASPLLEALGLPHRNALTRLQIEAALSDRGNGIVKEKLGLDPVQFCLVCIPPDLHLRIGMRRGWGKQEIWTHFDGYMLTADGKMNALAGGDVRFGGVYDLVAISRNYGADRIIARFAVVQRRRLARVL
jgi:hypothetical protein